MKIYVATVWDGVDISLTVHIRAILKIFINKTTRGYEIAENFRSHYTSICFDDNFHK
jgi:hypothetical protein